MKVFADALGNPTPKDPAEKIVLKFDFSSDLPAGVTLTGGSATVTTLAGSDGSPSSMLNGTPSADATGKILLVPVQAGVDDVDYAVKALAVTTNAQIAPALTGRLQVRSGG